MVTANLNGSYHSAIIGMDAQFTNQASVQRDIDRVERALYLGNIAAKVTSKVIGKEPSQLRAEDADFTSCTRFSMESCQQAVDRMATANKLKSANISVIIVAEEGVAENGVAKNADSENNAEQTVSEQTVSEQTNSFEKTIIVNSLAKALVQLERLVKDNKLVALVGINSAGLSHKLSSEQSNEQQSAELTSTISFDQTFNGYQACSGIAGLLFASTTFVETTNCYVYSWLKGFAVGFDVEGNIEQTIQSALNNSAMNTNDVGLLEVSALANPQSVKTESSALLSSYQSKQLTTAISCARSVSGEGKGFSQVLGLLRTVIALQQRYIPAISDWQHPQENELALWQASNFYLPTESRPWFPHQDGSAHVAAYSCLAANDDYCHLVLQENLQQIKSINVDEKHPASDIRHNGFIACSELKMVLVTADSEQGLLSKLIELQNSQQSLSELALSCYNQVQENVGSYTVSLLAESTEELLKEIQSAASGITTAFETQKEWRTPKGSYFTPVPVNVASADDQNISFLYPGIGATYVGLGRDLFHLFPEIHQDVANLADDIGASLKDTLLNPRTISRPDFKALKQLDLDLRGNLADIAEAGVGFACVFTKVFENVFKVKADYATGYSMGEVSMYAALGAWQQPGLMSARLAQSDTFNHRLCGDLLTLREHWGLGELSKKEEAKQETADELIWETYTIKATLDEVIAASEGEERVYCTIINTPDSLLLAGYPADCLRVIKKLGVRAMALNMANAIHSAPANKEYDDMVELYTMEVMPRIKTKMYSSSCYLPVPQLSKAIAHSVAKCLCDRVDFPRLVNTMHNKGARVFIEMGPGRSLCSWVDKILDVSSQDAASNNDKKPRVAVPVNAKGTSDELTYFRAIAKLISHGVKLDLHTLFNGSIIVKSS